MQSELDITRINDRLYVAGMLWSRRTEKQSNRNNVEDVANWVNSNKHRKFMVWNLTFLASPEFIGKPNFSASTGSV
jgi:hypothetical protein